MLLNRYRTGIFRGACIGLAHVNLPQNLDLSASIMLKSINIYFNIFNAFFIMYEISLVSVFFRPSIRLYNLVPFKIFGTFLG